VELCALFYNFQWNNFFELWKATMEYHRTKDILYVMKLLGHKNISITLIYTQLVEFEDNEYDATTASSVDVV
jgi:integrase